MHFSCNQDKTLKCETYVNFIHNMQDTKAHGRAGGKLICANNQWQLLRPTEGASTI